MIPPQTLRFLLADDLSAGKMIMVGLQIRGLIARDNLEQILIVAPGSLVEHQPSPTSDMRAATLSCPLKQSNSNLPGIVDNLGYQALTTQCIPIDDTFWSVERYNDLLASRQQLVADWPNAYFGGTHQ